MCSIQERVKRRTQRKAGRRTQGREDRDVRKGAKEWNNRRWFSFVVGRAEERVYIYRETRVGVGFWE